MVYLIFWLITVSGADCGPRLTTRPLREVLTQHEIASDVPYATEDTVGLSTVRFTREFVGEFIELEPEFGRRFLRAIQRGFKPAASGSGLVRITDVHKALVEVKVIGTKERLLGCLRSGELELRRVITKRNENKGGALARYRDLCT